MSFSTTYGNVDFSTEVPHHGPLLSCNIMIKDRNIHGGLVHQTLQCMHRKRGRAGHPRKAGSKILGSSGLYIKMFGQDTEPKLHV